MKSELVVLLLVIQTLCVSNDTFVIMETVNDQMTSRVSRTIKTLATAAKNPMWGGYTRIVSPNLKDFDPFIFLAHHTHRFSPRERSGFPAHAHRGFETVTYILDGAFDHKDSTGNAGRYGAGDVQWMVAGKGVLHSEMFVTDSHKETTFNGFQLWLNLPKKLKMSEPSYQMLWAKDIPVVSLPSTIPSEKTVTVKIIAGQIGNVKANVEKSIPLSYLHVKMPAGTGFVFDVLQNHHALAYVMSGSGDFGPIDESKKATSGQYVMFEENGNYVEVQNNDKNELEFLLLEGEPFKEPIVHRGPFVMNTQEEIVQANMDLYQGKFGYLEDDE